MLQLARIMVVVGALTGCSMAMPPNATPCELEGHASQACQTYIYSRAGM